MKSAAIIIALLFSVSCFGQNEPTVSMKEYVDMQAQLNKEWMQKLVDVQFEGTQKLIEIQFKNVNDNVEKANLAMEKRLDGMNEFRDTLKDQAGTFVTRGALWGYVTGVVGLIAGIAGIVFAAIRLKASTKGGSSSKNIQSGDTVEVKK